MKNTILTILFLFVSVSTFSQSDDAVWLRPNKGQWEDAVVHKINLGGGNMFVTRQGMTFHFHNMGELMHHHTKDESNPHEEEVFKEQIIQYNFLGANFIGNSMDKEPASFYENYYQGNDTSKWKSEIYAVKSTKLTNFLPGVDMLFSGGKDELKYTFELGANIDPNIIQAEIKGADKIQILENGNLRIYHRFGYIQESKPIAWQIINNEQREVVISFQLNGNQLSYSLVNYDTNYPLVIDPSLTFSTFSGSTSDNWGSTATPDANGNVFGGGIVFGSGFPTVPGSYDVTFNGTSQANMNFDVAIMKFVGTGASLMYSTYLGGALSNEFPSSMVCAPNGQLYVLGMTGSTDFPVSNGYDLTYNGGTSFVPQGGSATLTLGSDIFVTRFNPNGTAILSSTFVGGSGNDGYNGATALKYNYGDNYRGEITLDSVDNVYIASSTTSTNFPTIGAGGQVMQGTQSAVVFKMNSTLTTLAWSRYISGNNTDAGYSLQIANNGNLYVAGGTTSTNMAFVSGQSLAYNGGSSDGYIMRLNSTNGQTLNGTYVGMNEYDQVYFVQTDVAGDPYVLGQTESSYPITAGKYGNANSGQFIRKYTANLGTIQWTTMIGAGSGHVELSPTAFLVSDCYDIYLAGWGGPLNANPFLSQATFSTVSGFPVTSDAYQGTTLGDNFYLAVLSANAATLKYATFFGGTTNTQKHVDGGTSRFDKQGRVYHAVCASCGGVANGFTVTPGAWSTLNNSTNCNMAVFKFDLSVIVPLITVLDPLICYPDPVVFQNLTVNADQFFWDFGDGTTSTVQSPTHNFPGPGSYTVTLIASDAAGCYQADTSTYLIDIGDFQGGIIQPTDTLCIGESYQLQATGGATYAWSPAQFLDDSTSATPIATIIVTTVFTVIVSDTCGVDTLTLTLHVYSDNPAASNDTNLCLGESVPLWASGGATYQWSPSLYLDNPNIATPICTADSAITYTVTITTINNCVYQEQVFVNVFYNPPMPAIDDTIRICRFTSKTITVSGADVYTWDASPYVSPLMGPTVTLSPLANQYFICNFTNPCGTKQDSVYAVVIVPDVNGFGDTTICPGDKAVLSATGAVSYSWSPIGFALNPAASLFQASPNVNTTFQVIGQDQYGCFDTAQVLVQLYPKPTISTQSNVFAIVGDIVELVAVGDPPGGNYLWSPSEHLSCPSCPITFANPDADFLYDLIYTDLNSCKAKTGVKISYDAFVYIPNTFTPDGDAFNGIFSVVLVNVKIFRLEIYNRWGELIHVMTENANYWDGTYNGRKAPDGVYNWKIVYYDQYEKPHLKLGHINVMR